MKLGTRGQQLRVIQQYQDCKPDNPVVIVLHTIMSDARRTMTLLLEPPLMLPVLSQPLTLERREWSKQLSRVVGIHRCCWLWTDELNTLQAELEWVQGLAHVSGSEDNLEGHRGWFQSHNHTSWSCPPGPPFSPLAELHLGAANLTASFTAAEASEARGLITNLKTGRVVTPVAPSALTTSPAFGAAAANVTTWFNANEPLVREYLTTPQAQDFF